MLIGRVTQYWILSCKSRYRLMKSLAGLPWKLGAHTVLAPHIALKGSFPAPFWSVSTGPITLLLGSRCLFFFFFLWRMQWFVLPQFTKAWRVIEKGTNTKWSSSGLGAPLWVVFHLCYFTQPSLQNCNFEQPRQEAKDWASKDRQASDSTAG